MTLINIQHLTQKQGDAVVLNDVNLKINKNTIFGIIGDKDSGKTTLMEVLAGVVPPTEGSVTLGGYDVTTDPNHAKSLIGYMPESMPFYNGMTAIEYLTFVAEAKGLSYIEAQKSVKSALSATDLIPARDALISKLNRVGKVRLGLAQALVANPQILLLDSPTYSLSESESEGIFKIIKTLSNSKTVLIASRDVRIAQFCNETVTLSFGQLDFKFHNDITDGEVG